MPPKTQSASAADHLILFSVPKTLDAADLERVIIALRDVPRSTSAAILQFNVHELISQDVMVPSSARLPPLLTIADDYGHTLPVTASQEAELLQSEARRIWYARNTFVADNAQSCAEWLQSLSVVDRDSIRHVRAKRARKTSAQHWKNAAAIQRAHTDIRALISSQATVEMQVKTRDGLAWTSNPAEVLGNEQKEELARIAANLPPRRTGEEDTAGQKADGGQVENRQGSLTTVAHSLETTARLTPDSTAHVDLAASTGSGVGSAKRDEQLQEHAEGDEQLEPAEGDEQLEPAEGDEQLEPAEGDEQLGPFQSSMEGVQSSQEGW
ncbi:hypothetical protein KC349_g2991 [Hortaea werneckii]|nr:hypothetical protein KC349_g2991 [Hortaea werneckii]